MLPVNSGPVVITTSLTELKEKLIQGKTFEDGLLDSLRSSSFWFSRKNNISGKILFRIFTYQPDTMVAALAEWEKTSQDKDTCTLHWPMFTGLCWTQFVKLFVKGIYLLGAQFCLAMVESGCQCLLVLLFCLLTASGNASVCLSLVSLSLINLATLVTE